MQLFPGLIEDLSQPRGTSCSACVAACAPVTQSPPQVHKGANRVTHTGTRKERYLPWCTHLGRKAARGREEPGHDLSSNECWYAAAMRRRTGRCTASRGRERMYTAKSSNKLLRVMSDFAATGFNSKATWVWDLIKPVSNRCFQLNKSNPYNQQYNLRIVNKGKPIQ